MSAADEPRSRELERVGECWKRASRERERGRERGREGRRKRE